MQSNATATNSQEDLNLRFAAMCVVKRMEVRAYEAACLCLGIDISGPPVGTDPRRPLGYDPFVTIPKFRDAFAYCLGDAVAESKDDLQALAAILRTMDADYQADIAQALEAIERHVSRQGGAA